LSNTWFTPGNLPASQVLKVQPTTAKPKIMITMPNVGSLPTEFVERTWKPLTTIALPWCDKTVMMCRVPSLPLARNHLVREFLKGDCTHMFCVDSDIIPESPEDINVALKMLYDAMVSQNVTIVSGLYRAKQAHGFNYAMWVKPTREQIVTLLNAEYKRAPTEAEIATRMAGYVHVQDWGGNWVKAAVVGAGFMLIKRIVMEDMRKHLESIGKPEQYYHWEIPETQSEDFDFLDKANKIGHPAFVMTDVRLSHMGTLVLSSDGKIRVPSA
jgi:hypothetical protein